MGRVNEQANGTLAAFEAERSRLRAIAYRMLGTPDDADDVVQDTWLRWDSADRSTIDNPGAWLTTVATRISLDKLKSAQRRRETYVGPWLPAPVSLDSADLDADPVEATLLAESVSFGFMTVMERLAPTERAVFLLHDVFGVPFDNIADTVGATPANARQIAKRARDRVRAERPRFEPDPDDVERLADQFLAAVVGGDVDGLAAMLSDDVVHVSDGGAARHAARRPVVGRERVARFFANLGARTPDDVAIHPVRANGQYGWYVLVGGEPFMVLVANWADGLIDGIFAVLNPDKLRRFHAAWSVT